MEKTKGRIAYESYMENLGRPFTAWKWLPEEFKESWEVAAAAVEEEILKE